MKISPLAGHIGAVVTDIDLTSATRDDIATIKTAITEYLMLAFPDQGHMTDEQQVAFTTRNETGDFFYTGAVGATDGNRELKS